MTRAAIVTIDHLEVKKSDLNRIKNLFKVTDNAEAVNKAMELASGKIELEMIFRKYKCVEIEKIYA